ncbi:hypothetical protein GUI04_22640, partial [Xanthomonas citri pv. citri]|nr:hypothetical protein [Xanthomonas citri pv. citri]
MKYNELTKSEDLLIKEINKDFNANETSHLLNEGQEHVDPENPTMVYKDLAST